MNTLRLAVFVGVLFACGLSLYISIVTGQREGICGWTAATIMWIARYVEVPE